MSAEISRVPAVKKVPAAKTPKTAKKTEAPAQEARVEEKTEAKALEPLAEKAREVLDLTAEIAGLKHIPVKVAGGWARRKQDLAKKLAEAKSQLWVELQGVCRFIVAGDVPLPAQSQVKEEGAIVVDLRDLYEDLAVTPRASTRSPSWGVHQVQMVVRASEQLFRSIETDVGFRLQSRTNRLYSGRHVVTGPETEIVAIRDYLDHAYGPAAEPVWALHQVYLDFLGKAGEYEGGPIPVLVTGVPAKGRSLVASSLRGKATEETDPEALIRALTQALSG